MNTQSFDLDDILDSLMVEESKPSYATLTRWIGKYPQFSKELADFFAVWAIQAERLDGVKIDSERFANLAVSHAMELLHRREASQKAVAKSCGVGLFNAIAAAGKTVRGAASALKLDLELLKKLDLRRLTELPDRLCEAAGEHLSISAEAFRSIVVGGPPRANSSARHKANGKLSLTTETFAHAVKHSALPEDKKAYWAAIIAAGRRKANE